MSKAFFALVAFERLQFEMSSVEMGSQFVPTSKRLSAFCTLEISRSFFEVVILDMRLQDTLCLERFATTVTWKSVFSIGMRFLVMNERRAVVVGLVAATTLESLFSAVPLGLRLMEMH